MTNNYLKLALLKPDDSIVHKLKADSVERIIIDEVVKIKSYSKNPTDVKLIRFIALLIENLIKKKYQADKLLIFTSIIKVLFPDVTFEEIQLAISILEFGRFTEE
jgi:hypothetical protein